MSAAAEIFRDAIVTWWRKADEFLIITQYNNMMLQFYKIKFISFLKKRLQTPSPYDYFYKYIYIYKYIPVSKTIINKLINKGFWTVKNKIQV